MTIATHSLQGEGRMEEARAKKYHPNQEEDVMRIEPYLFFTCFTFAWEIRNSLMPEKFARAIGHH
jgi:hypothetical protein